MQDEMFKNELDLSGKRVLLGLSGGINSAGVLCYLASEYDDSHKPEELHIYAIQLKEHSPDTFKFMKDCIRYASSHFKKVRWTIKWGSVLDFFRQQHMIPHPILSPCSEELKMIPINNYYKEHNLDFDLIGYVRTERNRIKRQAKFNSDGHFIYPIAHLTDDDCFAIAKREIGWYPKIYDIKIAGKRVFHHNNCLPCKNMEGTLIPGGKPTRDYEAVALYYPEYFEAASNLASELNNYWGRIKKTKTAEGQMSLLEDTGEFGYCQFCEM